MRLSKKIARNIIFPSMMRLGMDKMIRKQTDKSILNIIYHGVVSNDSTWFSPGHITVNQFEQHLKYYAEEFDIISVREAFNHLRSKTKPKRKALSITFDDGYQNNLITALPVLEKYDMKATFFISSVCAQDMPVRILWRDLIACLNFFHKDELIEIGNLKFKNLLDETNNVSLPDYLKSCDYAARDNILKELSLMYDLETKLNSIPEEIWKLLTKDELIKLSGSHLVDIGSHGHLHYDLGNIKITDAERELQLSKSILENTINNEVDMIAYPYGSYTSEIKNLAEQSGYQFQMAVDYKYDEDKEDLRIMNRHGISNTTTFESNIIHLNKAFATKGI